MVDHGSSKFLPGRHRSGVAAAVGCWIGDMHLIEAVTRLGASTGEVSPLTTVEAFPISGVLHWPLSGLLPLHILASRVSSLESIAALDELVLWSLIALHCGLRPLLELGSWLLLLRGTLDRSYRWCTNPVSGVITTLALELLLTLVLHDTAAVLQYQCLVHHVLEIHIVSGLRCTNKPSLSPMRK
jgi:hypothetical protein